MQIIKIGGATDYRLLDQSLQKYFINDTESLHKIFLTKADGQTIMPYNITIHNRTLVFQYTVPGIIWCTFSELCEQSLWVTEYQTIINHFNVIFISDVPYIANMNTMKRFIVLVDELYENKAQLFCSAIDKPRMICSHTQFQRTASRLIEMCK